MFTDTVYCVNWPFLCYRDDNTRVVNVCLCVVKWQF